MKVKTHEIIGAEGGEYTTSVDYDQAWLEKALDGEIAAGQSGASLHLDATLQMNGDEVLVRGSIATEVALRCSRCLEPAANSLSESFDLLFVPSSKAPKPGKHAEILLGEDELDIDFFDGEEIDLDNIAQEQLLLALPPYPTCKEDCKGLCATCGKNLNEGPCACKPEETIDPRLSKLAKVRLPEGKGGDQ